MIGQREDLGERNGAFDGVPAVFDRVAVVREKSVEGPPDLPLTDEIVRQVEQSPDEEHGEKNGEHGNENELSPQLFNVTSAHSALLPARPAGTDRSDPLR